MNITPSEPDLYTITRKINSGDLILKPDFQRDLVWPIKKRKRLIDTILRGWYFPPIHIIENTETGIQEVLDGQQRLSSIYDFFNNKITIDGYTPPQQDEITHLDGATYDDLPEQIKRRLNNYSVRFLTIKNYKPEETAELFYRLNQPTSLTAAEQRNAYFGIAREQIKDLTAELIKINSDNNILSFSNSRYSYDDILARICLTSEYNTLKENISPETITLFYKTNNSFSVSSLDEVKQSIQILTESINSFSYDSFKIGKASFLSWIFFLMPQRGIVNINELSRIGLFISEVETHRKSILSYNSSSIWRDLSNSDKNVIEILLEIYNKKSSTRTSDASSILARDVILNVLYSIYFKKRQNSFQSIYSTIESISSQTQSHLEITAIAEDTLKHFIDITNWGDL